MNDICIVMPVFGLHDMTKRCIEKVRENAGMDFDFLVVDDGYKVPYEDDSVNILRLEKNMGFTKATNSGILYCGDRYKYLLFLNNDIVPDPNFLKPLYDHMESDPVTGIASSVRYAYYEGKKLYELYALDLMRGNQLCLATLEDEEPKYVDWVPTCCSLVRSKMIREIGLLDKQFRQHCSDSEYCIRANQNGWNVALIPTSRVEHRHQVTMHSMGVEPYEDQKRFIAKLAGLKYQELMARMPLDCESNMWGRIMFDQYRKYDDRYKPAATELT